MKQFKRSSGQKLTTLLTLCGGALCERLELECHYRRNARLDWTTVTHCQSVKPLQPLCIVHIDVYRPTGSQFIIARLTAHLSSSAADDDDDDGGGGATAAAAVATTGDVRSAALVMGGVGNFISHFDTIQ